VRYMEAIVVIADNAMAQGLSSACDGTRGPEKEGVVDSAWRPVTRVVQDVSGTKARQQPFGGLKQRELKAPHGARHSGERGRSEDGAGQQVQLRVCCGVWWLVIACAGRQMWVLPSWLAIMNIESKLVINVRRARDSPPRALHRSIALESSASARASSCARPGGRGPSLESSLTRAAS
jgi:hypothetical protein